MIIIFSIEAEQSSILRNTQTSCASWKLSWFPEHLQVTDENHCKFWRNQRCSWNSVTANRANSCFVVIYFIFEGRIFCWNLGGVGGYKIWYNNEKKKKKQLKRNKTLNSCEIFHIKCVHEKTNKPGNISQEFLIQIIVSLKTSNLGLLEVSIVWIFFFGFFFFHKNLGGNYQKIWNCNKKY